MMKEIKNLAEQADLAALTVRECAESIKRAAGNNELPILTLARFNASIGELIRIRTQIDGEITRLKAEARKEQ